MDKFSVTVAVCAHRDIKAQAFRALHILGFCPNPIVNVQIQDGDALISRSRSIVASSFLKKCQDEMLMFLDDDIIIDPRDAVKLMHECHEKKLPILGAAYPLKGRSNPGLAVQFQDKEPVRFGDGGKLVPMKYISSGCMIIRREVLERFIKKEAAPFCKHGNMGYYPFFQHVQKNMGDHYEDLSEDWYFCDKARELGYSIWCDTTIKLGHVGPYEYTWDDVADFRNNPKKIYDAIVFNSSSPSEREAVPS